jgi:hypothetical protein
VIVLALGIGATTAVFSVVYGVLLKPLPFRDPDRLVALYQVTPARQRDIQGAATYFTYRDHGRVFEDIGLWYAPNVAVIRSGAPEQVQALRVTDGTLPLLGVRAELGRLIGREDDVPGAPLVVVLTHAYWQQAFGTSHDRRRAVPRHKWRALRDHRPTSGVLQDARDRSATGPASATQPSDYTHCFPQTTTGSLD